MYRKIVQEGEICIHEKKLPYMIETVPTINQLDLSATKTNWTQLDKCQLYLFNSTLRRKTSFDPASTYFFRAEKGGRGVSSFDAKLSINRLNSCFSIF